MLNMKNSYTEMIKGEALTGKVISNYRPKHSMKWVLNSCHNDHISMNKERMEHFIIRKKKFG